MEQGHISLPYWEIWDYILLVIPWATLGPLSWRVSRRKPPAMANEARIVLMALCGVFAVVVGVFSLFLIVIELAAGQPHGPSPLWLGLFCLPFALMSAAIMRWLRARPEFVKL
jgi:hypothetical protein